MEIVEGKPILSIADQTKQALTLELGVGGSSLVRLLCYLKLLRLGNGKVFVLTIGEVTFDRFLGVFDRFLVGFAVGARLHGDRGEVGKGDEIEVIFVGPLNDEAVGIVHESVSESRVWALMSSFSRYRGTSSPS